MLLAEITALPRIEAHGNLFVRENSNEVFIPYGANYVRLDNRWHSVFTVGFYDPIRFENMLMDLRQNRLNIVRIFIDHRHELKHGGIATDSLELSTRYVANLLDGLERARRQGIYVILCLNGQPISKAYQSMFADPVAMVEADPLPLDHPVNSLGNMKFLHPGAIRARAEYFRRVVSAIADHDPALLSTVFSYELSNESYFVGQPPLSLHEGTFVFDDKSYDLSLDRELRRLMDDAVLKWADTSAAAIRSVDPKAMVSANIFTYSAVGRRNLLDVRPDQGAEWDKKKRVPINLIALQDSKLDYFDVHVFLHRIGESSVAEKLEETLSSIDFDTLIKVSRKAGKPLVVGEFAAFRDPRRTLQQQATDIREQLDLLVQKGFRGFLYWSYDADEQERIINLKMHDDLMLHMMRDWRQF